MASASCQTSIDTLSERLCAVSAFRNSLSLPLVTTPFPDVVPAFANIVPAFANVGAAFADVVRALVLKPLPPVFELLTLGQLSALFQFLTPVLEVLTLTQVAPALLNVVFPFADVTAPLANVSSAFPDIPVAFSLKSGVPWGLLNCCSCCSSPSCRVLRKDWIRQQ